jgi:hypothetical protein
MEVLSLGEMRRDKPWLNTEVKATTGARGTTGAIGRTTDRSGAETKCWPG